MNSKNVLHIVGEKASPLVLQAPVPRESMVPAISCTDLAGISRSYEDRTRWTPQETLRSVGCCLTARGKVNLGSLPGVSVLCSQSHGSS